jgi:putative Mg2+ transporter-C (MgtC) family protein
MAGAFSEFTLGTTDLPRLVLLAIRLLTALFIGAVIGLQRELTHKPAGLRTHMLVALGTAMFLIGAREAGMSTDALSRIVQGLATGIGFLGGGAILKLTDEREIHGLTTAAGIWMTAAASAAAGVGQVAVALIGTFLGLVILIVVRRVEKSLDHRVRKDAENRQRPATAPTPKDLA